MTKIQEYLRGGGNLAALLPEHGIISRRHPEYPNLVHLNYDMLTSSKDDPLVRECRSIILDEADNWRIVSRAFDRFFNYGEGHAAPIDWSTARVQEKVDGSLAIVYPYAESWHVASRGTPDAGGNVNGNSTTFGDYFWDTFPGGIERFPWPWSDAGRYCFIFELTGPLNRVVVPHAHAGLTLLGARDMETGEEVRPQRVAHFFANVPVVREFSLASFDDVIATFQSMSPLSQEGYVVVDAGWNRVKVKHPGYVAIHHAKDGMSDRAFVEIARSGESSEVVTYFPEFGPLMATAKKRVEALVAELEADYERIRDIPLQKDFAKEATKTRCSAALFMVRAGKVASVRQYIAKKIQIDVLMRLLGYKGDA
jgi:hypothetical protein